VDLAGFEGVTEVVLARNSCIHNGGHPSPDYLDQTKRRLLEDVDEVSRFLHPNLRNDCFISFDLQILEKITSEISEFADSLHKSLNTVRLEKTRPLVDGSPD
jgi:hypothetical protein